jgi:hypothetical protein
VRIWKRTLPNNSTRIRQRDITRALKGAVAAGMTIARVEIGVDGSIVLVTDAPKETPQLSLDKWMTQHARPA